MKYINSRARSENIAEEAPTDNSYGSQIHENRHPVMAPAI